MRLKKFEEYDKVNEDNNDDYKIGDYEFYKQEEYDGKRIPHTRYYIQYGYDYSGYLKESPGGNMEVEWDDEVPENWEDIDELVDLNYGDIVKNAPSI
jgi:hypothetical protein